ncbi:MAG TPA: tyrosine-protein phosphatase [Candidatus Melainabacteria bacterium]|nr:tyrosine-protein phosphatase [Candidatus Melainabacteria bacterium]
MSSLLTTVNPIWLTRIASVCVLATVCPCLTSIGAQAADTSTSASEKSTEAAAAPKSVKAVRAKEDLPNFHQVHPFLFRGGEPSREGLKRVKDMGVTTIFDLRNPGEMSYNEKEAAKELGMRYISMPMNSKAPTDKQIKKLLDEIDRAKGKSEGNNNTATNEGNAKNGSPTPKEAVFVHCAHGSDRTGCMIGIWRVKRDGYDYDTAYKEMRKYWFTPKFTNLSGAVRTAAEEKSK